MKRKDALVLNRSLKSAAQLIEKGEKNTSKIISKMTEMISSAETSNLDYINIVNADNFVNADKIEKGYDYFILIACRFGSTRLIDNFLIKA